MTSSAPAGVRAHLRSLPALRDLPGSGPGPAPHSLVAEEGLLSALILDPSLWHRVSWLDPERFYFPAHRHIWAALGRLHAAGSPHEIADVSRELQRVGRLADAGGQTGLVRLIDDTFATGDPEGCARDIHDFARVRQMRDDLTRLATQAQTCHAKDLPVLLAEGEQALRAIEASDHGPQMPGSSLAAASRLHLEALRHRVANPDLPADRLSTGLPCLDQVTKGMGRGELWIAAGRPGLGKSALAQNIVGNVAFDGEGAHVFSLEMKQKELTQRLFAIETGIPIDDLMNGRLSEAQLTLLDEVTDRFQRLPIWLDDTVRITVAEIVTRAHGVQRALKAKGRSLRLIVVDYLQLVQATNPQSRNREQDIAEISRELKRLAGDLDVTVLAVAQTNRESDKENRPPRYSDLRESGQLEADAAGILMLWRSPDAPPGTTDLMVAKQRNGPWPVNLRLGWEGSCTRFVDLGAEGAQAAE